MHPAILVRVLFKSAPSLVAGLPLKLPIVPMPIRVEQLSPVQRLYTVPYLPRGTQLVDPKQWSPMYKSRRKRGRNALKDVSPPLAPRAILAV